VRLRISPGAGQILGAVYIPGSDGAYRGGRVGGFRWIDSVRGQLDLGTDEFRRALGELCELGLVAVSKPSARGRGQLLPIDWRIRKAEEAAR
jgi:hypothetical protein